MAIKLCNAGVPLQIQSASYTVSEAVSHLPSTREHISPCYYPKTTCEKLLPRKHVDHLDVGSPDVPTFAIKVTSFKGGGTAIGILVFHCILDASAMFKFMENWSKCYRGLDLQPKPVHDRAAVTQLPTTKAASEQAEKEIAKKIQVVAQTEKYVPAFAAMMPKISGGHACVIPCPGDELKAWKASATAQLPSDVPFVSTDDVITARVWQAMVKLRCEQVGLSLESEEPTTIMRAFNIRCRTKPPLGESFCGNGVSNVWTVLSVRDCIRMTPGQIAARLRATINFWTPDLIAARAKWEQGHHEKGSHTKTAFDRFALTFVVSSWRFNWEVSDFNSKPICFDHGALVPIVAVLTPRNQCDGVNVWVSGKEDDMQKFVKHLKTK